MTRTWFVIPAAALILGVPAFTPARALPAPVFAAYAQEGWEVPPQEFNDIQRRGFHDGVEGARKDFGNGRSPDVDNRDEFRDPDGIPRELRGAYRDAFRRGYRMAASHLWGGPPPVAYAPPPPPNPGAYQWAPPPDRFTEIERRGYFDGMDGARKDYGNHRAPDPNNRDEYRSPHVRPDFAQEYREGFRRGYEVAAARLWRGM